MRRGYLKYEFKRKEKKTHIKKVSTPQRGFEKKSGQFKSNLRTNPLRGGLVKKPPIIQDEKQNKVKEWAKKKIQEELFKGKKKDFNKKDNRK